MKKKLCALLCTTALTLGMASSALAAGSIAGVNINVENIVTTVASASAEDQAKIDEGLTVTVDVPKTENYKVPSLANLVTALTDYFSALSSDATTADIEAVRTAYQTNIDTVVALAANAEKVTTDENGVSYFETTTGTTVTVDDLKNAEFISAGFDIGWTDGSGEITDYDGSSELSVTVEIDENEAMAGLSEEDLKEYYIMQTNTEDGEMNLIPFESVEEYVSAEDETAETEAAVEEAEEPEVVPGIVTNYHEATGAFGFNSVGLGSCMLIRVAAEQ